MSAALYAAGTLTLGCWDHWVPGANNALDKICNEWGDKNKVDVKIDYITSQGEKDKLTAAAEAQAGTGHDIMSHRDWNIRIHQAMLEPLDDVVGELIKQYGPISPVAEYLAKIKGTWRGVPTAVGSQVKPCCSRFDLYKEHAGIDLRDMFPADESKWDKAKTDKWTWDALSRLPRKNCSRPASRSACRWVRPATRSTGSAALFNCLRRRVGRRQGQHQDQLRRDPRGAGIPQEADGGESAGGLRLGRCRQQPLAHLREGLGHHEPAERLGGRQARQSEGGGEVLDASDAEGPEGPIRRAASAVLRLVEFSKNKPAGKGTAAAHLAEGIDRASWSRRRSATICRRSRPCTTSTPGRPSSRRSAPSTAIRRAATSRPRSFGAPARSEVGAQMYNQAINTVMVAKFTQGNEKLDDVIKWAEKELEGTLARLSVCRGIADAILHAGRDSAGMRIETLK